MRAAKESAGTGRTVARAATLRLALGCETMLRDLGFAGSAVRRLSSLCTSWFGAINSPALIALAAFVVLAIPSHAQAEKLRLVPQLGLTSLNPVQVMFRLGDDTTLMVVNQFGRIDLFDIIGMGGRGKPVYVPHPPPPHPTTTPPHPKRLPKRSQDLPREPLGVRT